MSGELWAWWLVCGGGLRGCRGDRPRFRERRGCGCDVSFGEGREDLLLLLSSSFVVVVVVGVVTLRTKALHTKARRCEV